MDNPPPARAATHSLATVCSVRTPYTRYYSSRSAAARLLVALISLSSFVLSIAVIPAAASPTPQTIYMPLVNPTANITPNPALLSSGNCTGSPGAWSCTNPCVTPEMTWDPTGSTPACTAYELLAINNARATIGESPLTLPTNWLSLTIPEQLFVIANLERTTAGYPPYIGLNAALTAEAQTAANANQDPALAAGFAVGNNPWNNTGFDGSWAGTANVLLADYYWMYADGWAGSQSITFNIACTGPSSWGCWDHRDELLGASTDHTQGVGLGCTNCEFGAAVATTPTGGSVVDLIELPAAAAPATTFTWASEIGYIPAGTDIPAVATVDPNGPPPTGPGTLVVHQIKFSTMGLQIAWALNGPVPVEAINVVYRGYGCALAEQSYQRALIATQKGSFVTPFHPYFSLRARYSYKVAIGSSNGIAWGRCTNLPVLGLRPKPRHK